MSEGIDLETMTRQWQEMMMDGWSKATKQVVGSDSFAAASSSYMDWALSWQKQMRNNTGQFMDSLEIPKRSDVARISKQVTAVEMRIADLEDRLDKMTGLLGAMSTAMQKLVEHSITSGGPQGSTPAKAPATAAPAEKVERVEKTVEVAPVKKSTKKAPARKIKA